LEEIMAANNLANPDVLDVGQQIVIPEAGSTTTAPSPTQAPGSTDDTTSGPTTGEQTHTVQAGDNLYRIGLQYGFTVDELAEYNNLTNVNSLVVGQAIRIPPRN
jgi:LysM repeat protein